MLTKSEVDTTIKGKELSEECPCRMETIIIERAKQIFTISSNVASFVSQMKKQGVIGRDIRYDSKENIIYITKKYACDCNDKCHSNQSVIEQRCHCKYVNHLEQKIPIAYCKCAASFYEPLFVPLFGENIIIEPIETVLSGGEQCLFAVRLDRKEEES